MNDELQISDIFDTKQTPLANWSEGMGSKEEMDVDALLGTFKDNTSAPIHRWFRYQTGFSYELVAGFLDMFEIDGTSTVLDPFSGVGTTVVEAKKRGARVHGVEVHPLISWIAEQKTNWDIDISNLREQANDLRKSVRTAVQERDHRDYISESKEPEFLYKVFDEQKLGELYVVDEVIESDFSGPYAELFKMALVSSLRDVSKAKTVFPYVQPSSTKPSTPEVLEVFSKKVEMIEEDLSRVFRETENIGQSTIHQIDARCIGAVENNTVDVVVTSPPYLNNVDYADMTRLELYFLGYASSWKEITESVRKDLINSSTVVIQDVPSDVEPRSELPNSLKQEITAKQTKLKEARDAKDYSGKKYDLMVTAYFNDMYDVMAQVYDKMKLNTYFLLVLGDSAPYGVHIPTDFYLGRVGEGIGFEFKDIYEIRERGDTWKSIKGSRRHDVDLRESIVLLQKR